MASWSKRRIPVFSSVFAPTVFLLRAQFPVEGERRLVELGSILLIACIFPVVTQNPSQKELSWRENLQ